jgi:branched-subunit amino acid ABC-type transport system permease component
VIPFVVIGVATGSLYGLAGLGLVLTYRTSGVFNLGHGALAAAGAFVFYEVHVVGGLPWPLAATLTLVLFGALGVLLERLTRSVAASHPAAAIVLTVGLLLAVEGGLLVGFGDVTRNFPQFLPTSGFTVAGVTVSWAQVIASAIGLGAAVGLSVFLRTTRPGMAMRAVVDSPELVSLTGRRPAHVRRWAWVIGSSFAALSGILLAPTLGLDATLLTFLVIQAFGACAIGGFSSLPLTYAGGLVVGIAASLATKWFTTPPWSGLPPALPFVVLIVVLLAVPVSRFPDLGARQSAVPEPPRTLARRPRWALTAAALAGLLLVPAIVGSDLSLWTAGLIDVVLLGSLALLTWTSRQISLCHMAFAALGAVTMSRLVAVHVPWGIALVLAGAAVVPVGALVAVPAIRLPGIYLALVTLGFGILMQDVVYPSSLMFGSDAVVSGTRPVLGFFHGDNDTAFYYLALAISLLACLALVRIHRGRLGLLLRAMAESPTMLTTHGLATGVTRALVFCVSAFLAGLAGALTISQIGAVAGGTFSPTESLLLLAVLAMCGTRLMGSTVLAAAALTIVPSYVPLFNSVDRQTLVFGVAAIVAGARFGRGSALGGRLGSRLLRLPAVRTPDDRGATPAGSTTPPSARQVQPARAEPPSIGAASPVAARSDARP